MMKRRFPLFITGFLALLVLLCGAFAWYCHVPVQDPAALSAIEARVAGMLAHRESIPAGDNGWEALRPVWGFRTDSVDEARLTRLKALPTWCMDQQLFNYRVEDMRKLLAEHGPELLAAEKQSLVEYPALKAALEKPSFFYPTKLLITDPVPNFLATRSACQLLAALGALRAAQGRPAEALEPLLLGLRMGARLSENGGALANAIGVACASICVTPLLDVLNEGKLSPERCRALVAELDALPLGPQQFLLSTDAELVASVKALRSVDAPGEPALFRSPPLVAPLWAERQKGLLVNLYLSRRPQIEKLEMVKYPDLQKEYPWDSGFVVLMPNTERLEAFYKFLLVRVTALKTMATLAAGQPLPEGTGLNYKPAGKDYELSYSADWLKLAGEESGTARFHPAP